METWSETNEDGRWRAFEYDELTKRDKLNLDIFCLKDESLEDAENLPEPEVLAAEIAEDLQAALEAFEAIRAVSSCRGRRNEPLRGFLLAAPHPASEVDLGLILPCQDIEVEPRSAEPKRKRVCHA